MGTLGAGMQACCKRGMQHARLEPGLGLAALWPLFTLHQGATHCIKDSYTPGKLQRRRQNTWPQPAASK
jgi:hypothetical protein